MRGQARDYDQLGRADRRRGLALGRDCLPLLHARTRTTARRRRTNGTAPAANGASRSSACAGTSSTPSRRPRSRPASRPATTSTAATTKASATSRSTSSAAVRWNAAKAFLRPACMQRANLTLWTGAQVARAARSKRDGRRRAALPRRRGCCTDGERGAGAARARGDPRRRRDRLAADPAAVGHRRRRALLQRARHRRRSTSCPASARTCRTTCRSARSSRCDGVKTLNTLANSLWGKARHRPASTC